MAQTGQRGSTPVSPANRTGKLYQQQLRDKKARDEATSIDINEVRRQAYAEGHAAGWEAGFQRGWDSLAEHLVETGVLDADTEDV